MSLDINREFFLYIQKKKKKRRIEKYNQQLMWAGITGKWQWQLTINMRRGRKKISKDIIRKVEG